MRLNTFQPQVFVPLSVKERDWAIERNYQGHVIFPTTKGNPKNFKELSKHAVVVIDLDQDVIIACMTVKTRVDLKNISPHFMGIQNTMIVDFQHPVRRDL